MSSYIVRSRNNNIELGGLSFDDKLASTNISVNDQKHFIMAEDMNQIKKSVNDICQALETFSNNTTNDIKTLQTSNNNIPARLSREISGLSSKLNELNQFVNSKIEALSADLILNTIMTNELNEIVRTA